MLGFTESKDSGAKRETLKSPLRSIDSKVESFARCILSYSYNDLNQKRQFCVQLRSGRHCTNKGGRR